MKDMKGGMPMPTDNGTVRGDEGGMPNRGTGTGMGSECCDECTGGCDLSQSATNRMGGMGGAAKSDKGGEL